MIAAKHGVETQVRGPKAFYYLGGLTEGTETIAAFIAFCLMPADFWWLAYVFGALCCVTTLMRFLEARRTFPASEPLE